MAASGAAGTLMMVAGICIGCAGGAAIGDTGGAGVAGAPALAGGVMAAAMPFSEPRQFCQAIATLTSTAVTASKAAGDLRIRRCARIGAAGLARPCPCSSCARIDGPLAGAPWLASKSGLPGAVSFDMSRAMVCLPSQSN